MSQRVQGCLSQNYVIWAASHAGERINPNRETHPRSTQRGRGFAPLASPRDFPRILCRRSTQVHGRRLALIEMLTELDRTCRGNGRIFAWPQLTLCAMKDAMRVRGPLSINCVAACVYSWRCMSQQNRYMLPPSIRWYACNDWRVARDALLVSGLHATS